MRAIAYAILCSLFLMAGYASAWADGVDYNFSITGIEDEKLESRLKERSLLVSLADKKPANMAALNRRIKSDLKSFKIVMQEHGYFGASLKQDITEDSGKKKVTLTIDKGALYTIENFDIEWGGEQKPDVEAISSLAFPLNQTALPETLLDAEQQLFNALMQNGYYEPQSKGKELRVHHNKQSVSVRLSIVPGPKAVFGATDITGFKRLEEPFVRRRIAWNEGEVFNIEKIARTRKKLNRSGVISNTEVQYGEVTRGNALPVTLAVKEGKHRSVGAGVAYSTTLELVGNVFWEHRNLFGGAEKFRVKLEGGTQTYGLSANLNKPDLWGNEKLGWQNSVVFKRELLEAFDKDTATYGTTLNYKYSGTSAISGGFTIEQNRIEEGGEDKESFTMVSVPLTYRYDNTNDALDPREGLRFNVGITPYQVLNEQNSFVVTSTGASHYLPLGENFVWANRARAAVIHGQRLEDVPADKRLYAGGGGSVRGYGYQLLGPLDAENDPTGGRMAFEVGTEGRVKVTEDIELIGFIEGGRVSEDMEFNSDADFFWSAGGGVRYHTPIGPLRFDLAVPLDKRDVDNEFQFYISIGQAF